MKTIGTTVVPLPMLVLVAISMAMLLSVHPVDASLTATLYSGSSCSASQVISRVVYEATFCWQLSASYYVSISCDRISVCSSSTCSYSCSTGTVQLNTCYTVGAVGIKYTCDSGAAPSDAIATEVAYNYHDSSCGTEVARAWVTDACTSYGTSSSYRYRCSNQTMTSSTYSGSSCSYYSTTTRFPADGSCTTVSVPGVNIGKVRIYCSGASSTGVTTSLWLLSVALLVSALLIGRSKVVQ